LDARNKKGNSPPPSSPALDDDDVMSNATKAEEGESLAKRAECPSFLLKNLKQNVHPKTEKKVRETWTP